MSSVELVLAFAAGAASAGLVLRAVCRRRVAAERRRVQAEAGQQLVRLVRNLRHGFMNHLQVVSGWLQLKKPERAAGYLESVRRKREQEAQLFRVGDWRLLTMLLTKASSAEAHEVEVVWQIHGDLERVPDELVEWLRDAFDHARDCLTAADGPRRLQVQIIEDPEAYSVTLRLLEHAGGDGGQAEVAATAAGIPAPVQQAVWERRFPRGRKD